MSEVQEMKNKVLFWQPEVYFEEEYGYGENNIYKGIWIEVDVFNYHINWVVAKGQEERQFFDDYEKAIEWYLEE